jgi:adenylate kinase family enzyme
MSETNETLKNERTNTALAVRPPLVVELMGPAGVGKTTLSRALRRCHADIAPDIDTRLSKIDKLPFVISNTCSLLPTYLRRYRDSRWFNRRETRSMAYLQAGLNLLKEVKPNGDRVIVLDHGPIYRLAFLREFGPEITKSQAYERWWVEQLKQWIAKIDVVVSLDAPNEVLLNRIRARDSWHTIKGASDREAYEILSRYRRAFERTIAEVLAARRLTLLRFDTSRQSTEEIVDTVSTAFASSHKAE